MAKHRYRAYIITLLVASMAVSALSACDSGGVTATPMPSPTSPAIMTEVADIPSPTVVPTPEGMREEDSDKIYAVVVSALLGEKIPPVIYISPYVGQGERLDDPNETQPLPQTLLQVLPAQGSESHYELADFQQVIGPLDDGGKVKNNGVFITLGSLAVDAKEEGVLVVRGSIYRKVGSGEGMRFRLRKDAPTGDWKILDSTQEWSDS